MEEDTSILGEEAFMENVESEETSLGTTLVGNILTSILILVSEETK